LKVAHKNLTKRSDDFLELKKSCLKNEASLGPVKSKQSKRVSKGEGGEILFFEGVKFQ